MVGIADRELGHAKSPSFVVGKKLVQRFRCIQTLLLIPWWYRIGEALRRCNVPDNNWLTIKLIKMTIRYKMKLGQIIQKRMQAQRLTSFIFTK
jgi:hypothetical protein